MTSYSGSAIRWSFLSKYIVAANWTFINDSESYFINSPRNALLLFSFY